MGCRMANREGQQSTVEQEATVNKWPHLEDDLDEEDDWDAEPPSFYRPVTGDAITVGDDLSVWLLDEKDLSMTDVGDMRDSNWYKEMPSLVDEGIDESSIRVMASRQAAYVTETPLSSRIEKCGEELITKLRETEEPLPDKSLVEYVRCIQAGGTELETILENTAKGIEDDDDFISMLVYLSLVSPTQDNPLYRDSLIHFFEIINDTDEKRLVGQACLNITDSVCQASQNWFFKKEKKQVRNNSSALSSLLHKLSSTFLM